MVEIRRKCPLLREEADENMSPNDPQSAAPGPELRWYQFSLRTLMLFVTAVAVICSIVSTVAWWHRRYPSESCSWGNHSSIAGSVPYYSVTAYAINGEMPTIACFVRIDDPRRLERNPNVMPWLFYAGDGEVFVEGRLIEHRPGVLQLFVDDGSDHPTLVILDPPDARKYFGRDGPPFVDFKTFSDFWNDVLRKKYLPETHQPATK